MHFSCSLNCSTSFTFSESIPPSLQCFSLYSYERGCNHSDVDIVNTSDGAMPNMGESEINYFIEKTGAVVQPKQAWTDIARVCASTP